MKYIVSLKIDCGTLEVEADSELDARQKAIINYYLDRKRKGKDESFKYIAEISVNQNLAQEEIATPAVKAKEQGTIMDE